MERRGHQSVRLVKFLSVVNLHMVLRPSMEDEIILSHAIMYSSVPIWPLSIMHRTMLVAYFVEGGLHTHIKLYEAGNYLSIAHFTLPLQFILYSYLSNKKSEIKV